jgi:putative nucleotidyltransferase with HDIG domain
MTSSFTPSNLKWLWPSLPTESINWGSLFGQFSWLHTLRGCPQDPTSHAEGDVLTHTKMVCEALVREQNWVQLDAEGQFVLFMAALLHDIGKPICTSVKNGRITAPNHPQIGAQITHRLLYQEWPPAIPPIPLPLREQIVNLVKYHGIPLWYSEFSDPKREIAKISLKIQCRRLARLTEADMRGRQMLDMSAWQGRFEQIEGFRQLCLRHQCFEQPYPFSLDEAHVCYSWGSPSANQKREFEVVVLAGLPGIDKEGWCQKWLPDMPIISLDHLRIEMGLSWEQDQGPVIAQAQTLAQDFLHRKQAFIWDAPHLTRHERKKTIALLLAHQARIRLIYFEVPWSVLLRQNQQQPLPLSINVLTQLANTLQVPTKMEAHHVDWCTDGIIV